MNFHPRRPLALAFSFVVTVAARAADDNQVIFPGSSSTQSPAASGGLHTVSLVVGLVLAAVGAWFVWRNRRGVPSLRANRALTIDETRSLGNRQYLVVASHQGKSFLLGVCPGQISLLSALPDSRSETRAPQ